MSESKLVTINDNLIIIDKVPYHAVVSNGYCTNCDLNGSSDCLLMRLSETTSRCSHCYRKDRKDVNWIMGEKKVTDNRSELDKKVADSILG